MDLSPNDIRNYEFPNQMRGYDKEEVDNFLEQVAVALEEARQSNLKLSMEVDSLKTQLAGLKEFEDTIKNAAIDARRNADTTISNAKKEAEEIVAGVRKEAEELAVSHQDRVAEAESQMAKLEHTRKSYISQLRSLINSHLDMVDEIATADIKKDIHGESDEQASPENGSGGIEVTESEDVTRQSMETLSSEPGEQTIETEEANAPEPDVVAEHEAAEEPKEEETPEEQPEPKPVDPELAAALERYQAAEKDNAAELNPEDFGPAPPQGTIVETDQRAEDVPPGFIARVADAEMASATPQEQVPADGGDDDTGEVEEQDASGLSPDAQDRPTEHNVIDIDRPTKKDKAKASVSPDELAEALDGVVSKFEEEMDKAEKS